MMNSRTFAAAGACAAAMLMAPAAHATPAFDMTTFVSGVGDDINPCSRTAPCKTFAGAISKTAVGGSIRALDPGGFGTVTINKSVTIEGVPGATHIISANTNGINVNVTGSTVVVLRNLIIEGVGTGLAGVLVSGGGTVVVDNVSVQHVTGAGIDVAPGALNARVQVRNARITDAAFGVRNQSATSTVMVEGSVLRGNATAVSAPAGDIGLAGTSLLYNGQVFSQLNGTISSAGDNPLVGNGNGGSPRIGRKIPLD